MDRQLRCFLSAPFETDLTVIKSVLDENNIEIFNAFEFSIGYSLPQILKRKLRQVDFAIFVISKNYKGVLYEIGVCEGIGKESLIIIDKNIDKSIEKSIYLEDKFLLKLNSIDDEFLKMNLLYLIERIKTKKKAVKRTIISEVPKFTNYDRDIQDALVSLLELTKHVRIAGQGFELEEIVKEIFKTIRLKYVDNNYGQDIGIDFALWNDKLGRTIGNPIIVELKLGILNKAIFKEAENQILNYANKSDAKVALLLYLDRKGKRFNLNPSLNPLIIAYDVEDFISELIKSSFENVIITSRNKIAHRH